MAQVRFKQTPDWIMKAFDETDGSLCSDEGWEDVCRCLRLDRSAAARSRMMCSGDSWYSPLRMQDLNKSIGSAESFVKESANWRSVGAHLIVAPRRCMHCREMTRSKPQRLSSTLDGDDSEIRWWYNDLACTIHWIWKWRKKIDRWAKSKFGKRASAKFATFHSASPRPFKRLCVSAANVLPTTRRIFWLHLINGLQGVNSPFAERSSVTEMM